MEELKKYIEFEPFFVTPSYPEDQFDSELFRISEKYYEPEYIPDFELISTILKEWI